MTEFTQEIGHLQSMYISASQAALFISFSSLCLGGSNCAYVANSGWVVIAVNFSRGDIKCVVWPYCQAHATSQPIMLIFDAIQKMKNLEQLKR